MSRARLVERLDKLAAVTVITALPGSGKTALAADWAWQRVNDGDVVAWMDAGPDDDDPVSLYARLHDLIARHEDLGSCGDRREGDRASGLRGCVRATLAASRDRPTIVVVDRADAIVSPDATGALSALLGDIPSLHIVLCSRAWHPIIGVARRDGLSVSVVTGHELAATTDEISSLSDNWGHGSRSDVTLHRRTRGWLLPTRLILDRGTDPSSVVGHQVAEDYARTTVLPTVHDEDTLSAAMRLALAERITAVHLAEVAAAMPHHDGVPMTPHDLLGRLVRAHLLGPCHHDDEAWTIVPVLRQALVAEYLTRAPADVTAWHRRFATALRDAGRPGHAGRAVLHARAARDWPLLVELWETASLPLTYEYADDLVAAYSGISFPVLAKHPALAVAAAVAQALTAHPDGVATQRALVRAFHSAGERLLHAEGPNTGRPSSLHLQLLSTAVMVDRAEGRYDRAIASAMRLDRELAERERTTDGGPVPVHRAWVLHQWAQTMLLAGEGHQALTLASRAFIAAHDLGAPAVTANIAADIALIHAIGGSIADAEHWLDTHSRYDTTGRWMHHAASLPAHVASTLMALDRLEGDAAEAELAWADDRTGQSEMWPFVAHAVTQHALIYGDPIIALSVIDRYARLNARIAGSDGVAARTLVRSRADLYLALGEVNLAQRLVDDAGSGTPWLQVSRARFHLICGDYTSAVRTASATSWDPATMLRDRIDVLMIRAAASHALGDAESAGESFTRAVALAARLGTLRPYALIDADVRNALIEQCGTTFDGDARARLDGVRQVYPARADLITLTERELAVLGELTRHKSWSDIAGALVVAPSTVKKQILSIYSKLDVHDRENALLRAGRLGLLP